MAGHASFLIALKNGSTKTIATRPVFSAPTTQNFHVMSKLANYICSFYKEWRFIGVVFGLAMAIKSFGSDAKPLITSVVDWPAFMARHDMVWHRLPETWREGVWFGNGVMGSMIWREGDRIRIQVFRSDVVDHRSFRVGYSGYSRPRLQIGSFYIKPKGKIKNGQGRLDLYNAEFTGTIETDLGRLRIRHLVNSTTPVILTEIKGEDGESDPEWEWEPAEAKPTRPGYATTEQELETMRRTYGTDYFAELYQFNPVPEHFKTGDVEVNRQLLLAGSEHSVAWKVIPAKNDGPQRCFISIANCWPGTPQNSDQVAATAVKEATEMPDSDLSAWIESHRQWWHSFYAHSFISLTDTRVETVYWTQMYKLASATRDGSPIIDHGLWQTPSPWTFLTWDLNIQLTYWPTTTANHLDIGMSLVNWLWSHRDGLINNVPVEAWRSDSARAPLNSSFDLYQPKEADMRILDNAEANLTWVMHDCWMMYRRTMDDDLLREKIYPLLKRAVNNQLHHLYEADGRLHMPPTESPEYGMARDANYELASIRWGCQTLLEICQRLKIGDAQIPQWQDVLKRLADYPVDADGFQIGADEPFGKAHRHASHLLMIYPYCLVNVEQPENRKLLRASVEHFYAINNAAYEKSKSWNVFAGYTYTLLSLMHAVMGDGEEAERFLNGFIDYPLVARNGMYAEAGPVLETPLCAAHCVHEMLMQSWGDRIRIFPAIPASWKDVVFHDLLAEGAFEVSAERRNGATRWVRIKSLAGEPCRVRPGLEGEVKAAGARPFTLTPVGDGVFDIDLTKEEEVLLYTGSEVPVAKVAAIPANPEKLNWYGLK